MVWLRGLPLPLRFAVAFGTAFVLVKLAELFVWAHTREYIRQHEQRHHKAGLREEAIDRRHVCGACGYRHEVGKPCCSGEKVYDFL